MLYKLLVQRGNVPAVSWLDRIYNREYILLWAPISVCIDLLNCWIKLLLSGIL